MKTLKDFVNRSLDLAGPDEGEAAGASNVGSWKAKTWSTPSEMSMIQSGKGEALKGADDGCEVSLLTSDFIVRLVEDQSPP